MSSPSLEITSLLPTNREQRRLLTHESHVAGRLGPRDVGHEPVQIFVAPRVNRVGRVQVDEHHSVQVGLRFDEVLVDAQHGGSLEVSGRISLPVFDLREDIY